MEKLGTFSELFELIKVQKKTLICADNIISIFNNKCIKNCRSNHLSSDLIVSLRVQGCKIWWC